MTAEFAMDGREFDGLDNPNAGETLAPAFSIFSARQVLTLPPVPFRVPGIALPMCGLAAIVGASGDGKGLVTEDLAFTIARGTPFRGELAVQQCPVAIIVAEGWSGIPARQRAVYAHHRIPDDEDVPVTYIADSLQLDEPTAADQVAAILRGIAPRPRLLFVDTYRATHSGDENDSGDVARYIRSLQMLAQAIDGLVCTIAHTGWTAERERGSSAFRAAMDWVALVQKEDDIVTMSCLKAKDGPAFKPLRWRIEAWADSATVVPIGEKEQDRPTPRRWQDIPHNAQRVLTALNDFGDDGAPTGQLEKASRVPASSFYRTVKHLSQWGFVRKPKARLLLTDEGKALLP